MMIMANMEVVMLCRIGSSTSDRWTPEKGGGQTKMGCLQGEDSQAVCTGIALSQTVKLHSGDAYLVHIRSWHCSPSLITHHAFPLLSEYFERLYPAANHFQECSQPEQIV